MTKVKICGITRLEDALFAAESGPHALGFVFFRKSPRYIEPEAAEILTENCVKLVGIDYLSVEAFDAETPETHITLLENEVIILEGLDLRGIHPRDYELICLPLKIAEGAGDGAPSRTVLREI